MEQPLQITLFDDIQVLYIMTFNPGGHYLRQLK